MFDSEILHGVHLFGPIPADKRASLFNDLPAMRNAPRYDDGSLTRILPASGIGKVEATTVGPIIVTPFSIGGGYLGQFLAEQDALNESDANVKAGKAAGDLIYFGEGDDEDDFYSAVYSLDIRSEEQTYAAIFTTFVEDQEVYGKREDGLYYLEQLRIICKPAMHQFYESFAEGCVEQRVCVAEALWYFNLMEIHRYNPKNELYPYELHGVIGGDGDYEREQLAFGMLVENREEGIYRIWSRVYLCTK